MRAHRWREFARGYNGSGKEDDYGAALERNYTVARTLVAAAASSEAEITDYVEPIEADTAEANSDDVKPHGEPSGEEWQYMKRMASL